MEISFYRKGTLGIVRAIISATPLPAVHHLEEALAHPELKAAVISIETHPAKTACSPSTDSIETCLRAATIPTAAVLALEASDTARRIAEACCFIFSEIGEAEAHLSSLTRGRPAHVIRAVMTSVNNGSTMSIDDALLEETRLFCALSARKRMACIESLA